jgi:hypothetical protein
MNEVSEFAVNERALLVAKPAEAPPHLRCYIGTTVIVQSELIFLAKWLSGFHIVIAEDGARFLATPKALQKLPPAKPKERERWTDTPAFKRMVEQYTVAAGGFAVTIEPRK